MEDVQDKDTEIAKLKFDLKVTENKLSKANKRKDGLHKDVLRLKADNQKLLEKLRSLESEMIKLQQENSFVRHRSCGQKATYNAKIAQLWASKEGKRAYRCKFCNGWHLASK